MPDACISSYKAIYGPLGGLSGHIWLYLFPPRGGSAMEHNGLKYEQREVIGPIKDSYILQVLCHYDMMYFHLVC